MKSDAINLARDYCAGKRLVPTQTIREKSVFISGECFAVGPAILSSSRTLPDRAVKVINVTLIPPGPGYDLEDGVLDVLRFQGLEDDLVNRTVEAVCLGSVLALACSFRKER